MKKFDVKQMMICVLALLSSRFTAGGVCPLVPAVFMTGYMSGVNRSMLFLCTIAGLLLLGPVSVLVRYGLIVLASALMVKLAERVFRKCRTVVAAGIAGTVTAGVPVLWEVLHVPKTEGILIDLLEGLFVFGFVYVMTRISYLFLEWEPSRAEIVPVAVQGQERLNEYARSFNQLARTFQQVNRFKRDFSEEELGRMHHEVTGGLCISCSHCAACWEHEYSPMYQILYRFLQSIVLGEKTNESEAELREHCQNMDEMVRQVTRVFEKAHLNMAWYNRLQENRDAIAQQLDAMAYIMEDCANNEQDVTSSQTKMAAAVRYALKEMGILCDSLRILRHSGGKLEIRMEARTGGKAYISVKEAANAISRAVNRCFLPSKDSRMLLPEKGASVCFVETSAMTAHYGVARAVREGEQVSGDSFSFLITDGGKCILCLSDGMGSGYSACKESEMVIDLIEKFMESGFRPDLALRMMNSAMVTHGENNLFSTVDLAEIDLDSGRTQFYKTGAAATFILHDQSVRWIDDTSMPVGVFMNQRPAREETILEAGDYVVMMTDGALEYLDTDNAKTTMADIILSADASGPAAFAQQILQRILELTGGRVRDDMTILTAAVWNV